MRLAVLWLAPASILCGASYTFTSFDVPGQSDTMPVAIDSAGQVVGYNFLRSADGSAYKTITVPGATSTVACGIGPGGQILGAYTDSQGSHGFMMSADLTTVTSIDEPDAAPGRTIPSSINSKGQIAGSYWAGFYRGLIRSADGSIYTSFGIAGTRDVYAIVINDSGQVAGYYIDAGLLRHGFLRSADGSITTIDVPGSKQTVVHGINNRGQIAGYFYGADVIARGFVRELDGTFSTFDMAGAKGTYASGINDSGLVAGYSSSDHFHGFIAVPGAPAAGPMIRPALGVISALGFGGFSTIAPGTWIEIYGSNLASSTRQWRTSDFIGNIAPTSLDGIKVSVNGEPAFVYYISPGQVNALVPSDVQQGTAKINLCGPGAGVCGPVPVQHRGAATHRQHGAGVLLQRRPPAGAVRSRRATMKASTG